MFGVVVRVIIDDKWLSVAHEVDSDMFGVVASLIVDATSLDEDRTVWEPLQ